MEVPQLVRAVSLLLLHVMSCRSTWWWWQAAFIYTVVFDRHVQPYIIKHTNTKRTNATGFAVFFGLLPEEATYALFHESACACAHIYQCTWHIHR
jgi:hypothetical protein